jgi:hypothetical protein
MNKLYKYDGPALNYNGQVRKSNWIAYVKACSVKQALYILTLRYKRDFRMCNYVVLKEKYLKEEK